jgi:hypothetical protein
MLACMQDLAFLFIRKMHPSTPFTRCMRGSTQVASMAGASVHALPLANTACDADLHARLDRQVSVKRSRVRPRGGGERLIDCERIHTPTLSDTPDSQPDSLLTHTCASV